MSYLPRPTPRRRVSDLCFAKKWATKTIRACQDSSNHSPTSHELFVRFPHNARGKHVSIKWVGLAMAGQWACGYIPTCGGDDGVARRARLLGGQDASCRPNEQVSCESGLRVRRAAGKLAESESQNGELSGDLLGTRLEVHVGAVYTAAQRSRTSNAEEDWMRGGLVREGAGKK